MLTEERRSTVNETGQRSKKGLEDGSKEREDCSFPQKKKKTLAKEEMIISQTYCRRVSDPWWLSITAKAKERRRPTVVRGLINQTAN